MMLRVSGADLSDLRYSGLTDSEKLSDTLQCWIDSPSSSPVTWGTIVKVLRTDFINLPGVADKIQEKLSTELYDKYCHRQSNVNFKFPDIIIIIAIVAAGTTAEPVLTTIEFEGKSNV